MKCDGCEKEIIYNQKECICGGNYCHECYSELLKCTICEEKICNYCKGKCLICKELFCFEHISNDGICDDCKEEIKTNREDYYHERCF